MIIATGVYTKVVHSIDLQSKKTYVFKTTIHASVLYTYEIFSYNSAFYRKLLHFSVSGTTRFTQAVKILQFCCSLADSSQIALFIS